MLESGQLQLTEYHRRLRVVTQESPALLPLAIAQPCLPSPAFKCAAAHIAYYSSAPISLPINAANGSLAFPIRSDTPAFKLPFLSKELHLYLSEQILGELQQGWLDNYFQFPPRFLFYCCSLQSRFNLQKNF